MIVGNSWVRSLYVALVATICVGSGTCFTFVANNLGATITATSRSSVNYNDRGAALPAVHSKWCIRRDGEPSTRRRVRIGSRERASPLFMGRAAAVRAATKGKSDAKKAKTNALYGKKIIMAVKQGGSPDPEANRALKDVMTRAKNANVPVDNIKRAIKRASESNAGDFAESTFEAYGLGGASFIINVLSDNANRASAEVKNAINKNNGKLAESGSVLFMYDRRGKVEVDAVVDEEQLFDAAIDAGCDDLELFEGDADGTSVVYTDPKELSAMLEAVESLGHEAKGYFAYVSKAPVKVSDDEFEKNMNLVDALEELDDVDSVEHNMSN